LSQWTESFEGPRLIIYSDLVAALRQAEVLRKEINEWPPKTSRGDGRGLIGIIDDELGFVD